MQKLLVLTFSLFTLFSCTKEDTLPGEVASVVDQEVERTEISAVPTALQDQFSKNDLLIFGETHYVQEHQELIARLLPALHAQGYRVIFDEAFHSFSWMIEDYIKGEIEQLPEFLLYFNATLLDAIKEFNSTVPETEQFRLVYMDANHWRSNFPRCLDEIEKRIGQYPVFTSVKSTSVDTEPYRNELQALLEHLQEQQTAYTSEWGEKWYKRLLEIVAVEIQSSAFRSQGDDELRENIMYENITKVIQASVGSKFLVNTGLFHAQKKVYMGKSLNRIGRRLTRNYPNSYSIAFIGLKGQRKQNFADENTFSFDLTTTTDADDLTHYIAKLADDKQTFLPLKNSVFVNQEHKVTYISGTTVVAPIGEQFDAIFTYPSISTLRSMETYDWRE